MSTRIYLSLLAVFLSVISLGHGAMNICLPLNNTKIYKLPSLLNQFKTELDSVIKDASNSEHIDKYEFNFTHPAISAAGEFTDIDLSNFLDYNLKIFQLPTSGFQVFNLTFSNISLSGNYNLTGNIGDLFDISGAGEFWLNMINFSISADADILSITLNQTAVCVPIDVNVYLQHIPCYFYGLMNDEELRELINNAISAVAPDAIRIIWNEVKGYFEADIQTIINKLISDNIGKTLSKILSIYKTTDRSALSQFSLD